MKFLKYLLHFHFLRVLSEITRWYIEGCNRSDYNRKRSVFFSSPKEGQCQKYSNYCTIEFTSHASKVMLKILQCRAQQYMNWEITDIQAGFRKGKGTRYQIATSNGSQKKQGNSRKTSTSASWTTLKPLTAWITTNWKILQEMGIPNHPTCLLGNLYAGQEATVRTGLGTTDWFKMGKEQSHFWAYTLRKPDLKETRAPQCSLQHCL